MKTYAEQYPGSWPGMYGKVFRGLDSAPCCECGKLTHFSNLALALYVCSEECHIKALQSERVEGW